VGRCIIQVPAMNQFRKNLTLIGVLLIALSIPLTVVLLGVRQELRKRAVTEAPASAGYPNFASATSYGNPTTGVVAASSADSTGVQNIQAPTISGFSSDLFTGGATVNYPLDLPPGRGGLTPSLSLNYSSNSVYDSVIGRDINGYDSKHNLEDIQGGNRRENWYDQLLTQSSQVGLGWDISGLGYVFRDSLNRYTLVLNGQSYRLFKTLRGAGSADESCEDLLSEDKIVHIGEWNPCTGKWHTDPTSFLKIEHPIKPLPNDEPDKDAPPGAAPKSFTIVDTNGTIYTFEPRGYFWKRCDYRDNGCKADDPTKPEKWATFYNKWVLTKVADVHGNEISINYSEETSNVPAVGRSYPRAIYPNEINYSGSGNDFNTKVKFEFFNRLDWENLRGSGIQTFYSKKRVGKIDIQVRKGSGWETVRQYELDNDQYFESVRDTACQGPASSDGFCLLHPKLTKITAKGRDGTSLPSYSFDYYDISDASDIDPDANSGNGREGSSINGYNNFRLLHSANNGYGGKVEYSYEGYTVKDYDPKSGDWVTQGSVFGPHRVIGKTAYDGQGNSFKTTYGYPASTVGISDDAYHSGFESVGHEWVAESVFGKNEGSKIKETKYYFIQGKIDGNKFYAWPERGRLKKTEVYDGAGTLLSNSESDYLREPADFDAAQSAIWDTAHFIAAKETRSCQDQNTSWPVGNKATYHYRKEDQKTNGDTPEQWGNLTQTTEYLVSNCDFAGASAYRMTYNTYFPNPESHIINRVGGNHTYACNSNLPGTVDLLVDCPTPKRLSLIWNFYDRAERPWNTPGSKGELTSSRVWYEFPELVGAGEFQNGNWRTVDGESEYDQFGNLTTSSSFTDYGRVTAANGQWTLSELGGGSAARTSTTAYDSTYQTFPVSVTNPLGHQNRTGYWYNDAEVKHPYLANKIFVWDPNNQQSTTVTDGLGRPVSKFLPGESAASTKIDYRDGNPFFVHTQTRDDKDDGSPATYHHAWQIYNGLGQLIETQTEQEGDGRKIALTFKDYNALGQVEKELLPYDPGVAGGVGGKYVYLQPDWSQPQRQVVYDALGRVTKSTEPGNIITQTAYSGRRTAVLDPNQHLFTAEVDNLGRTISTRTFTGSRGLGVPADYDTGFYTKNASDYDHLNRLTKSTDTLGNITEVHYNQFGQKEWVRDPDLGRWNYVYYPTGTLATTTDAKGQVKSFIYDDLDRIKFKFYGDTGTYPVAFFGYDNTCQNGIGRLCSDVGEGVLETATVYNYDAKGRLASETKRIEETNYVTQFAYDAAGRQREITYPDGEKVTYAYNESGRLVNASGNQSYLASAKYNILGQTEEEILGNQTKNVYTYEPQTNRLDTRTVKDKSSANLWSQNLDYDPVGNITSINYPLQNLTNTYSYDDLNRLTGMTPSQGEVAAAYAYDQLGRMTLKTEEGSEEPPPECVPGKENPNLPGDLDCDCRVSIVDIMKVAVVWDTRRGGERFNPDYDFDGDGRISIVDVMYVASKWNTRCGQ